MNIVLQTFTAPFILGPFNGPRVKIHHQESLNKPIQARREATALFLSSLESLIVFLFPSCLCPTKMRLFTVCIVLALELYSSVVFAAVPEYQEDPYASAYGQRQESDEASTARTSGASEASRANSLTVDLGYERYQGVRNAATGINTWLGYRYDPRN